MDDKSKKKEKILIDPDEIVKKLDIIMEVVDKIQNQLKKLNKKKFNGFSKKIQENKPGIPRS